MARYRNAVTLEIRPESCQVPFPSWEGPAPMPSYPLVPPYRQDYAARTELECLRAEVQFLRELVKSLTQKSESGQ